MVSKVCLWNTKSDSRMQDREEREEQGVGDVEKQLIADSEEVGPSGDQEPDVPAELSPAEVEKALQSFSELATGSFLDLSDGARAAGLDAEAAARQKVWTSIEEALGRRSYVYRLDLSRQRLKGLPAEIGKLNKVEFCTLRENDLVHRARGPQLKECAE